MDRAERSPGADEDEAGEIKLDLETPLEAFASVVCFFALLATLPLLRFGLAGGRHSRADPTLLKYVPVALLVAGVALALRLSTDNYYVVRAASKQVLYHFECLGLKSERPHLRFSQVAAIGVSGTIRKDKRSRWYSYELCLIDLRGVAHPYSHAIRDGRVELNIKAELLSRVMGCRFDECPDQSEMSVERGPDGKFQATYVSRPLRAA